MAYCKNCNGELQTVITENTYNGKKQTYEVTICKHCGLEIKRHKIKEEDIYKPPQQPRPKDLKWDKNW